MAKSKAKFKTESAVRQLSDDPKDAVRHLYRMAREVAGDQVEVGKLAVLQSKITDGRQYIESVNRTFQGWMQWCSSRHLNPIMSDPTDVQESVIT